MRKRTRLYLIRLPEEISIENGILTITGNTGWHIIEKAIHKAVEAIEIDGLRDSNGNFVDKREGTDLYRVTIKEAYK